MTTDVIPTNVYEYLSICYLIIHTYIHTYIQLYIYIDKVTDRESLYIYIYIYIYIVFFGPVVYTDARTYTHAYITLLYVRKASK